MDFSEKLVTKIHAHRVNPVIIFIILSMAVAVLFSGVSIDPKLNYTAIIAYTLSAFLLFVVALAMRLFKNHNYALSKIEDFIILNSDGINQAVVHHEEMLSIISNFDIKKSTIKSDIVIQKFQNFLND